MHPPSNRALLWVVILLLLAVLAGGVLIVCAILVAIALPSNMSVAYRARRIEVQHDVDAIRVAELAHQAVLDTFVAVPGPVPDGEVGPDHRPWPTDTPFQDLGWSPDGPVLGAYRVEVSPDGEDFSVFGICDVDGDGVRATWAATRTEKATLQTPRRVH